MLKILVSSCMPSAKSVSSVNDTSIKSIVDEKYSLKIEPLINEQYIADPTIQAKVPKLRFVMCNLQADVCINPFETIYSNSSDIYGVHFTIVPLAESYLSLEEKQAVDDYKAMIEDKENEIVSQAMEKYQECEAKPPVQLSPEQIERKHEMERTFVLATWGWGWFFLNDRPKNCADQWNLWGLDQIEAMKKESKEHYPVLNPQLHSNYVISGFSGSKNYAGLIQKGEFSEVFSPEVHEYEGDQVVQETVLSLANFITEKKIKNDPNAQVLKGGHIESICLPVARPEVKKCIKNTQMILYLQQNKTFSEIAQTID